MAIIPVSIVCFGLCVGCAVIVLLIWNRLQRAKPIREMSLTNDSVAFSLPSRWLAIKHESIFAVQSAFHIHNPEPCSWAEGFLREERLFISPSIEGWIIVTGDSIPDPSEDPDVSFRFLRNLSRELGEVQYFSATPFLHFHSWIKVRSGKVIRAYVWAGQTVWNQGTKTREEKELAMRTFAYGDETQTLFSDDAATVVSNAQKVQRLAARWSLDLIHIRQHLQERGIIGTE
jgi:hypothetical protein